ncbi:WD40-repeat containing protein [Gracilaria domingensis]|nr:WD40-repeat containing protein [Gracilaria domingensis]
MATSTNRSRKKSRFSLLLLEEGEVLLSDLAVHYHFVPETHTGSPLHPLNSFPTRFLLRSTNTAIPGRVKLGTHNLFFDSDEWRDPVIRIPFLSIKQARLTRDRSCSTWSEDYGDSVDRAVFGKDNSVLVEANSATFQRELGTDHPYIDAEMKGRHIFTPLYTSATELMEEISTMLDITSIPSKRQREQRLKEIVQVRESRVPFDITLLEHGAQESAIMDAAASAIYAMARAPGRFRITKYNLYFMPIHGEFSQVAERIPIEGITAIRKLRHGCRNASVEVTYRVGGEGTEGLMLSNLMIAFEAIQFRDRAFSVLLEVVKHKVQVFDRQELERTLSLWRAGRISNFDYLMHLNLAAGRSFNDLSQYPVFPWILQDYESKVLDLGNPDSFRDLSNPIGALNDERLDLFRTRYEDMPHPKFFYGTHYSTPAYTINYLVRAAPAAMLRLQNGRFDTPDRLFHSIRSTWEGVLRNQGDVKELIPEFYALDFSRGDCSGVLSSSSAAGQFLENVLGLDLGIRQDGKRVEDVELPPWANGSAEVFIRRHREALECDFVSKRLHKWIDLIFGIKNKSAEAYNVFYTDVALPSSLDDTSQISGEEIVQIETVYLEFGRTPERLFGHPHPPRFGDDHEELSGSHLPRPGAVAEGEPSSFDVGEVIETESRDSVLARDGPDEFQGSDTQTEENSMHADTGPESLSLRIKSVWGSASRRKDSTLCGASDHIFASYKPSEADVNRSSEALVPRPLLSTVISKDAESSLLDLTVVCYEDARSNTVSLEAGYPILCTLWRNEHVKVYSAEKVLRSKHVEDICSMASFPTRVIACGTLNGSIGLYFIDTGRFQEEEVAAHDAAVYVLEYIPQFDILISGSKDASLKLWRVERCANRSASLRLALELDAESCVTDICGCSEAKAVVDNGNEQGRTLLIAASTSDQNILVWEVDVDRIESDFLEPIWRQDGRHGQFSTRNGHFRRSRTMTWLSQGPKRRHALATVHPQDRCLRIWKLDHKDTAFAEVLLSETNALCVASHDDSRTILVGGAKGRINEYDSTGLCLGGVVVGQEDVRSVILPAHSQRVYILTGSSEVVGIER